LRGRSGRGKIVQGNDEGLTPGGAAGLDVEVDRDALVEAEA